MTIQSVHFRIISLLWSMSDEEQGLRGVRILLRERTGEQRGRHRLFGLLNRDVIQFSFR